MAADEPYDLCLSERGISHDDMAEAKMVVVTVLRGWRSKNSKA